MKNFNVLKDIISEFNAKNITNIIFNLDFSNKKINATIAPEKFMLK